MIDYRYFPAFRAVAEHESVTSAARSLHLAASAISRQIKLLEEAHGRPLFRRIDRRLVLTDQGRKLLEQIQKFETNLQEALGEKGGHPLVRIGCPEGLVDQWLAGFLAREEFAGTNFEVKIGNPSELIQAMQDGALDFALFTSVYKSKVPAALKAQTLFSEEIVLLSKEKIRWDEIDQHRWICYSPRTYLIRHQKHAPENYIYVPHLQAIVELVRQGAGIAMVPSHAVRDRLGLHLQPVPKFAKEEIVLLTRKGEKAPPAANALLAAIRGESKS